MAAPIASPELHSPFDGLEMPFAAYLRLPEEKPALEYRQGRVVQKPVPNAHHRRIAGRIDGHFFMLTESFGGDFGPEGRVFLRSRGEMVIPDAAYWLPGNYSGDDSLPDVVVEVASPGQSRSGLREKCREYRQEGVAIAWLIDPEVRTVEVFEGDRDGDPLREGALESPLLPGFRLDIPALFKTPA